MNIGVYRLKWDSNPHHYYGSSINLKARRAEHLYDLRKGVHKNKNVQRVYEEYGLPEFEVLLTCDKEDRHYYEKELLELGETDIYCLNVEFHPTGKGRTFSEETRRRLSVAGKGRVFTETHLANMSKSLKGLNTLGDNYNAKKVINTETLEIYSCAKEVVDRGLIQRPYDNFKAILNGSIKTNPTPYEFLDTYEKNGNKKRVPHVVVKKRPSKKLKVISTETGDIYDSAKVVVELGLVEVSYNYLQAMLAGSRPNKTPFMYLENYENQNEKYEYTSTQGGESTMQVQHPQ